MAVVPFNQGPKQDVEALVDEICNELNLDLAQVSALPENGREIDGLDNKSEFAPRHLGQRPATGRCCGAEEGQPPDRHLYSTSRLAAVTELGAFGHGLHLEDVLVDTVLPLELGDGTWTAGAKISA